ncbi:MAG: hypothetical protein ACLP29_08865 [Dissulfurispiraceae bacterium]
MEEQMSDATGKKEHLTAVMLDAVTREKVERVARERDESMSCVIRKLIKETLGLAGTR